jgi:UDP-N-acetylmuramoylalanine--D-glutamate ligase
MTLEQLAKQGRRKEIFTTAFTINESICHARSETLRNSFVDCERIKNRNELVTVRNGVSYINDCAAHSLSATWFSLENLNGQAVWITFAGNDDYEDMISVVRQHVKAIICIGRNTDQIKNALGCLVRDGIMRADSIEEAILMAMNKAVAGDSVIFSPGAEIEGFDAMKMGRVFVKTVK